jgi:hypothetical protein
MLRVHYVMAVWGEHYRRTLTELVLPTMLSPGNLPGCAHRASSSFRIYTLPEDAEWLDRQPVIARLREIMPVVYHVIAPEQRAFITGESAYHAMSVYHRHAIRQAAAEEAYIVFMTADAIVSDGSFRALERYAEDGVDCVVLCGVRAVIEDARPEIERLLAAPAAEGGGKLTGRQMTDLLLRHPHGLSKAMTWNAPCFNSMGPGHLYWYGDAGILAHCWHLHPWMIRAVAGTENFRGTIDSDYVSNAAAAGMRIHVVQDSDDVCVVELSRRDHLLEGLKGQGAFDQSNLEVWAMLACQPVHRAFFKIPVTFRGSDFQPGDLDAQQAEAAEVTPRLHEMLETAIARYRPFVSCEDLRDVPAIYIYGAGRFGRDMLELMLADGVQGVRGFIDSEKSGTVDGLPMYSLAEYERLRGPDDLVMICSMYVYDIMKRLRALEGLKVMSCNEFYTARQKSGLLGAEIVEWRPSAPDAGAAA